MNHFATRIRQVQLPTTASDRPKTYLHSADLVAEHSVAEREHTQKNIIRYGRWLCLYLQSQVIDI